MLFLKKYQEPKKVSIATEEDLNELINTEVSDEVDSDEKEDSEKDNEKINKDNNINDCKNCNSKVSIINKESLCDTCVDRGPLDTQNIIGKVVDKKNNVYQIGSRFGIINTWLSRNVLQKTDAEFLDEVPDTMLTLKEIFLKGIIAVSLYATSLKNSRLFGKIIIVLVSSTRKVVHQYTILTFQHPYKMYLDHNRLVQVLCVAEALGVLQNPVQRQRRKHWVHPINNDRESSGRFLKFYSGIRL
ncbi:hypothetical protein ACI65C_004058 [Semiaphis heraclei]